MQPSLTGKRYFYRKPVKDTLRGRRRVAGLLAVGICCWHDLVKAPQGDEARGATTAHPVMKLAGGTCYRGVTSGVHVPVTQHLLTFVHTSVHTLSRCSLASSRSDLCKSPGGLMVREA